MCKISVAGESNTYSRNWKDRCMGQIVRGKAGRGRQDPRMLETEGVK